ncbi:hypothetical protein [Flavobacterium sp.]|uniref:hypothetical protein n=1 Tax=Flavobacterium sp. TaxID=239 RepID=UPI003D6A9B0F
MRTKIFSLFIAIGIIAVSCNKDENAMASKQGITREEIAMEGKFDKSIDDVDNIIEQGFLIQSGADGRALNSSRFLSDCGTITSVLEGNTWTVTIDFGIDGCTLSNGNILKGKIILSFTNDFQTMTKVISYTFENFYHNDISLNGNKTFTRVKANANGNPESRFDIDMTLTLANGDAYTRTGLRVREWTAGHDTPHIYADDIHLITGNWTTTSPNGTKSATITVPLKKLGSCHYIVEGIIVFTRNDSEAILDFGNGECDNQAMLTIDGGVPTAITL